MAQSDYRLIRAVVRSAAPGRIGVEIIGEPGSVVTVTGQVQTSAALVVGDRVLCGWVGAYRDDLVIIGRMQ